MEKQKQAFILSQKSYQEIKEHFMVRFKEIDSEMVLIEANGSSSPQSYAEIQKKIVAFV